MWLCLRSYMTGNGRSQIATIALASRYVMTSSHSLLQFWGLSLQFWGLSLTFDFFCSFPAKIRSVSYLEVLFSPPPLLLSCLLHSTPFVVLHEHLSSCMSICLHFFLSFLYYNLSIKVVSGTLFVLVSGNGRGVFEVTFPGSSSFCDFYLFWFHLNLPRFLRSAWVNALPFNMVVLLGIAVLAGKLLAARISERYKLRCSLFFFSAVPCLAVAEDRLWSSFSSGWYPMLEALFFLYSQRIRLLWVNSVRRGEGILCIKLVFIEAVA